MSNIRSKVGAHWSRRDFVRAGTASFASAVLLSGYSARSWAATFDYYISPTGSDANPGTMSAPWSISALNTKRSIYAGRRVGLLDGTYNVNAAVNANIDNYRPTFNIAGGTASNPTVIQSVNPRGAHITAKSSTGGYGGRTTAENCGVLGNNFAYDGVSAGHVVIDGLRLSGARSVLLRFGLVDSNPSSRYTPNVTVQNCELFDCNASSDAEGGNKSAISINNANNVLIRNNYIHDIIGYGATNADHVSATIQWGSNNCVYEYNTIVRAGPGIYVKQTHGTGQYNNTMRFNYIECTGYSAGAVTGIQDCCGSIGTVKSGSFLRIHNNVVIANRPLGLLRGSYAGRMQSEIVEIYNNTLVLPSNAPSGSFWVAGQVYSPSWKFYNNLCTGTSVSGPLSEFGGICMASGTPSLMNNNSYATGTPKWSLCSNGGATYPSVSDTSLSAWRNRTGAESSSMISDPLFATTSDVFAATYKLVSSSPLALLGRLLSGATVQVGAWGGASFVGCDFAAGLKQPNAPAISVS